ncbi:MAG: ABC transporter permease [Thermoanaerobaculia bacterium]
MSRLVATMSWDVRLQVRNGFYYAAGFVALFMVVLLLWPSREDLVWILPVVIFTNLMINTFYFFSGLVLLEKREGTLEAQVVTPLRTWEYLGSKLATLTALAVGENLAITVLAYGVEFRVVPLLLGMLLAAVIYCLVGFALVARYDSINEFLMPSFLVSAAFSVPLLPYFGYLEGWWHYLHPLMGPLLLLEAAFVEGPAAPLASIWEQVYAVAFPLACVVPVFLWSRREFQRFIVASEGSK